MSRVAVVLMLVAFVGCHNAPAETDMPIERHLGVFEFSEHVTPQGMGAESVDIEGSFVVFGDTVTVEARPGPCWLDTRITSPNPITYDCGGVTISFDRRNPTGRAMYSVKLTVTQTRTVCARYATDARGRQYCAETRSEPYQRTVTETGYLRAKRATSGPEASSTG